MSLAKRNSLLWLTISGLLILVLAMGLPGLELSPGQPFSLGQAQMEAADGSRAFPGGSAFIVIFQGFIALALIFLPVYIVFSLLTPKGRQRLIADLVVLMFLVLLAEILRNLPRDANATQQAADNSQGLSQLPGAEPTVSFSAAPPPWLTPVVLLLISLATVAAVGGLIWFFRRRKSRKNAWSKLAQEAQEALEALQSGGDFKLTIVRCYQEMSRVVREERGIARETAMTPREFEDQLVGQGLPQAPVSTLTRLFEQVRYGSLPAEAPEEAQALACLTEIAEGCRSLGRQHEG